MKRVLILIAVALLATSAFAAADPAYTALRNARPDGRTVVVNNLTFDRDVYHVTLNGTMHLLAPVNGTTAGAVFTGHGSYELTPVSEVERTSLAINSNDASLKTFKDDFDAMTIFDVELMDEVMTKPATGAPDATASQVFDRFLNFEKKDWKTNVHIRVLQALLNGESSPLFIAVPEGKKYPKVVLRVDGLGTLDGEETSVRSMDSLHGGWWYSSHLKGEKPHVDEPIAKAAHYAIDTTLSGKDDISGTTTIDLAANAPLQVLPFELAPTLRITEASFATGEKSQNWTPLAFVQENEKEDGDAAVIFPTPLQQNDKVTLRLKYHGKEVLRDAGDGNYYVQARESWYPNLGTFYRLAMYDLTYHFPKAYQIVSVGDPVDDKLEGDTRTATFKTAAPVRVVGFNFGKFKKISKTDKDTGLVVDVYTNPGTPDIIKRINAALSSYQEEATVYTDYGTPVNVAGGPSQVYLDTNGLADSAMADAVNASRVASFYFGATSLKHLAITQQTQFDFGQSWPGVVYLPYLAVLSSTTRAQLGLAGASDFIDQVGPHEVSHQWWGHNVGWANYHDQWLSEGFADFSAALVLQFTGGVGKYNKFWETSRKNIVGKPVGAFVNNADAGPITLGARAGTWRNQYAGEVMMYNKGAYVLHMLRMLMQDRSNKQNPDEAFIAMMTDFTHTFAGRNASTADFKMIVDRHMTPALNAAGDGKSDWFFNQWVYGTAIPKLTSKIEVQNGSEGKFHIIGTITQADVPEDFKVLVPVYAEFDKGQIFKIAAIPMSGSTTKPVDFEIKMPKKPKQVTINLMHDILTR